MNIAILRCFKILRLEARGELERELERQNEIR
jgi:hypothetical protein